MKPLSFKPTVALLVASLVAIGASCIKPPVNPNAKKYSPFPEETRLADVVAGKHVVVDPTGARVLEVVVRNSGETLSSLASRCYGTSAKWTRIAEWNQKTAPYLVRMGETIKLQEPCTLTDAEGEIAVLKMWRTRMGLPNAGPEFEHAKKFLVATLSGETKSYKARVLVKAEAEVEPAFEPQEPLREVASVPAPEPVVSTEVVTAVNPTPYFTQGEVDQSLELLNQQKFAEAFEIYWNTPRVFSDEAKRRGIVVLEGESAERLFTGMTGVKILSGRRTTLKTGQTLALVDVPRKQGERMVCAKVPGRQPAAGSARRTVVCLGIVSDSE